MSTTPNYPASEPFTATTTLDAPDQHKTHSSKMHDMKTKAASFGRSAAVKIDRNLDSTAGFLERSALRLRSRSSEPDSWTQSAAGRLESTASYLRRRHTDDMIHDLDRTVRKNPSASMAACFGVGFLIGMLIRRSD
jgi:ElaB/YqjD/DUF883 family membrane-anchored ribosome-binding protein